MTRYELRQMSRAELEKLFRERKAALIEVRDEIDRRDRENPKAIEVDFEQYVTK
jgi:ribosomal protein L29